MNVVATMYKEVNRCDGGGWFGVGGLCVPQYPFLPASCSLSLIMFSFSSCGILVPGVAACFLFFGYLLLAW
jgi:hypothetical protein